MPTAVTPRARALCSLRSMHSVRPVMPERTAVDTKVAARTVEVDLEHVSLARSPAVLLAR